MSDLDSSMLERLHQQSEEIMSLRAEIERLQAELEEVQRAWHGRCVIIDEQEAEIERLAKAVAELDDVATAHDRVVRTNERLKAALREIVKEHPGGGAAYIARAALEEK